MKKKKKAKRASKYLSHTGQCIFCGKYGSIEYHHIIQKRFGGPDSKENLVPICPQCHRVYHCLTDQLLNYLLEKDMIYKHEPRPVKPIEIEKPSLPSKPEVKKDKDIVINNSQVTINF